MEEPLPLEGPQGLSVGDTVTIEEDNCCGCNAIAIRRHFLDENMTAVDIVYTSCHDAVYETPFYVAVDHDKKKVVISIRGTLSPKDALTDLTGDAERLPVEGHHGTWLGHKGMVLSAEYIKKKLEQEMVLSQAFGRDLGRGTKHYGLIVVGHSLGAGTAAILSFLLRPQYPTLKCFAYSPPGGLLSEDAMEYSKEFVTAVVLGKDLVPRAGICLAVCSSPRTSHSPNQAWLMALSRSLLRIGLSQLEGFRRQLLDVLQRSTKPKVGVGVQWPGTPRQAGAQEEERVHWVVTPPRPLPPALGGPSAHSLSQPCLDRSQLWCPRLYAGRALSQWRIIVGATKCIPKSELPEEVEVTTLASTRLWTHPSDLTIALSASTPLYPPGRIIHVVHSHPAEQCCCCEQEEPTYFAIWGDNKAFNEVIISPAMLHEHLPYVVMEGLNKPQPSPGCRKAEGSQGKSRSQAVGRIVTRWASLRPWGAVTLGGGEWDPSASMRLCLVCEAWALAPHRPQGGASRPSPPPPTASPSCPQVLENYNKGKTALLSAAKVMVSPTEVDLTPEIIFQQQPLPTGPPMPTGLALELPTADHRNSSVR
ncbi:hypothetical protein P7K49_021711 [Saguinus oedipus]|uniref:sn-1-specific diacylglycerol lipase n=1 Tax=Saguinus oedipus TaxID=9490 RepID=A0ABQ9UTF3_SAGOE|nr:hypothetical protein P7K49_021711 [Saguinus oedipus]